MKLAAVLAVYPHLLLDFDGPVCTAYTAMTSGEVTAELAGALGVPDAGDDPLRLLHSVHASAPELSSRAERTLTALERRAVAGAVPTTGLLDLLTRAAGLDRPAIVVSNTGEAAVTDFVQAHGLDTLLAGVVARTRPDPALLMPGPHLLEAAADRLGADPGECALLGDSPTAVGAARRVGAAAIAFANRPGRAPALSSAGPDALIHSLSQVTAALRPL
jgi:beta-phosphoglucomutase-like phosphatase (HAD superfamily)